MDISLQKKLQNIKKNKWYECLYVLQNEDNIQ